MIENHWANSLAEDNLVELWWTCGGELCYKMFQEQSVVELCRIVALWRIVKSVVELCRIVKICAELCRIVKNCAECCGIVRLGGGLHRKPTPDQRSLNERWSRRTWCVMMMIMMMVMFKMGMKHESKRLSARWVTLTPTHHPPPPPCVLCFYDYDQD